MQKEEKKILSLASRTVLRGTIIISFSAFPASAKKDYKYMMGARGRVRKKSNISSLWKSEGENVSDLKGKESDSHTQTSKHVMNLHMLQYILRCAAVTGRCCCCCCSKPQPTQEAFISLTYSALVILGNQLELVPALSHVLRGLVGQSLSCIQRHL